LKTVIISKKKEKLEEKKLEKNHLLGWPNGGREQGHLSGQFYWNFFKLELFSSLNFYHI
jgi:hypothetical protein